MKLFRAYVDRDDHARSYLDIRVALPRTLKQRRTRRAWTKLSKVLPHGTNVTQIVRFPTFTGTVITTNATDSPPPAHNRSATQDFFDAYS